MDLLQLLTSSENLYKYLLIGGLGLIVLSVFYPIERKYELRNKVDVVNKDIAVLNYRIDELRKDVQTFHDEYGSDSAIKAIRKNRAKLKEARDSFDNALDSFKARRSQISYSQFDIAFSKAQANTFKDQISEFTRYQFWFVLIGIIISITGIVGWFFLMKKAP